MSDTKFEKEINKKTKKILKEVKKIRKKEQTKMDFPLKFQNEKIELHVMNNLIKEGFWAWKDKKTNITYLTW